MLVPRKLSASPSTSELTEDERAFLQRRVGLFGLVTGGLFLGFWVLRVASFLVVGPTGTPWASGFFDTSMVYHLVAGLCLLAVWAACARGKQTPQTIRAIEAAGLVSNAIAVNLMATALPLAARVDYIVLLSLGTLLTSRAIYVPSTRRRSLALAAVIGVATLTGIYVMTLDIDVAAWAHIQPEIAQYTPREVAMGMTFNAATWWVVTMMITMAASDVIYGLRRDARAAMQLGQYKLETKLGEGGMGIVYKAHHALLRRPTAVKVLLPERAGERSIERFELEVRLMAKLRHPNTVTVFDYGRSPDGAFYYAMEYIDGATLGEVVAATGPFEVARAVRVLEQAAAALVEAHGVGLIHRDIKPANLMLFLPHPHGGIHESVKLLDFGLVKEISTQDEGITQANTLIGTPQYMAPETIRNPDVVDARSDIYALGCLMFFLLTGEHVFSGESVMDVCAKHLHETPDTVSARRGGSLAADVETLVSECLSKDPAERPASARELQQRLAACQPFDAAFTAHDAHEWWEEFRPIFERQPVLADQSLSMAARPSPPYAT